MKALVLSSGGVDSTTALALAVSRYGKDNVIALSVSYGQKHDKEIQAAKAVSAFYGCLLYTSPSPRDRQKSRMPSSA